MLSFTEHEQARRDAAKAKRLRKARIAYFKRTAIRWALVIAALFFAYNIGVANGYEQAKEESANVTPVVTLTDDEWEVPTSICARIDWTAVNSEGQPFKPFDANEDGFYDCRNDEEMGA